jgi:hypothetical protein
MGYYLTAASLVRRSCRFSLEVWYEVGMRAKSLLLLAALASSPACTPDKPADAPTATHTDETLPKESDTPPPPPPPPATVSNPPSSNDGTPYDKDAVQVVLKRAARQVKANCGAATNDEGKATGPWGQGSVTVTLGHNGHSKGATVGPPFDGTSVGKCIVQAFAILTFPPFAGADTPVDWQVDVVKPAGAAGH